MWMIGIYKVAHIGVKKYLNSYGGGALFSMYNKTIQILYAVVKKDVSDRYS